MSDFDTADDIEEARIEQLVQERSAREAERQAFLESPEGLLEWAHEAREDAILNFEEERNSSPQIGFPDTARAAYERDLLRIVERIGERLPGSVPEGEIEPHEANQVLEQIMNTLGQGPVGQAERVEQKTPEQSAPVHDPVALFETFKAQVTGQVPIPGEQIQHARPPSLGAAMAPEVAKPEPAQEVRGPSKMPLLQSQNEASVEHLRGVRLMDLSIPSRDDDRERTPEETLKMENGRQVSARMAPTLGQQMQAVGGGAKAPEIEEQGQQGKGQGGQERPNDPSYYTQFSQTISLPERDVQSAEKLAARRAVDRSRGRGGMGL